MFLNPFAMVVGGALISAPILIHLINRMRFKRIRWAAMEFLLKSQKRNRRRLIIEQLILLMLRCLLVLLAGLLVARFVGEALGVTSTSGTTHVVLLDNTLSMQDKALRTQQPQPNAWEAAKTQIKTLAKNAAQAPSAQNLTLMTLTDHKVIFSDRLNDDESVPRLNKVLDDLKPTAMHADAALAVEAAKQKLAEGKDTKRWLHLVSDFRDQDWGRKTQNEKLHQILNEVAETGAQVTLIDTAAPSRESQRGKGVDYHNNFAITELKPDKRIAPAGAVVPFTIEVENFGNESLPALFIEVFVNGVEDFMASKLYDPAPSPGSKQRYSFDMIFDGPAEGQRARFHRVTARIKSVDADSGLLTDNVRHAIVEIRKEVPTLIIDGNLSEGRKPGGDTRHIADALESVKGQEAVKVVVAEKNEQQRTAEGIEELLRPDLEREYATIYFLNVESLRSKNKEMENLPLEKLKQFVRNGGNIVFFTGDRIDAGYYNDVLFEEAQGLFPVPIEEQGTRRISDKEIETRRNSNAPKIFVLDKDHDITRGIHGVQYKIPDLIIPQHTPARQPFLWDRPWAKEGDVKELIALAELKPLTEGLIGKRFVKPLQDLMDDPNHKKYQPLLRKHRLQIEQAALGRGGDETFKVAEAFDNMLNDRGDKPNDKDNISLVDFWALPDAAGLKRDLLEFRKSSLYGKPLVVSRKYGKGSTVAVMTTAGTRWSGWPGGSDGGVASFTFPMFIADLQKYLTRGGDSGARLVGDSVRFELDPKEYKGEIQRIIQADEGLADKGRVLGDLPPGFVLEEPKIGTMEKGKVVFTFENSAQPGVHYFKLTPLGGANRSEERWFAFNVDPSTESNLRRAAAEEIARNPAEPSTGRGKIRFIDVDASQAELREKKSDLSESPWLYILILLVLIVEQALAVHLSFHVKGGEAAAHGPAAAAAPAPRQQAAAAV